MNTKARGTLRCRWRHRKRSIDVGDGNYPAALLKISLSNAQLNNVFFFPVFVLCVDSFIYMIYTLSCF